MTAIVLEDEAVIAVGIAAELSAGGMHVPEPFPTSTAALHWLAHNHPDVAVVDLKLADGFCCRAVDRLCAQGVPIVFFTGVIDTPASLKKAVGARWIFKPASLGVVVDAVYKQLAPRSALA
ncbi:MULTISPECIES: hypothetical protein [unclassified Chelatococcus]|uniref:hypothetical protein n=1 Tax=unclassified Chelatococcus TaxID=2638111 RepID=UPI001BCF513A|nr:MULTISPECIES: hypothetical protein [unclassified Chelatococcus]MBS7700062.1 hypothetical protein [Chelatococcus sp. YT9]MBX3556755.1 hypothetical protein [Chelatococcus sp.]